MAIVKGTSLAEKQKGLTISDLHTQLDPFACKLAAYFSDIPGGKEDFIILVVYSCTIYSYAQDKLLYLVFSLHSDFYCQCSHVVGTML